MKFKTIIDITGIIINMVGIIAIYVAFLLILFFGLYLILKLLYSTFGKIIQKDSSSPVQTKRPSMLFTSLIFLILVIGGNYIITKGFCGCGSQSKARDTARIGHLNNISKIINSHINSCSNLSYFKDFTDTKVLGDYIKADLPNPPIKNEKYYIKSIGTGFVLASKIENPGFCNIGAKDIDTLNAKLDGKSRDDVLVMILNFNTNKNNLEKDKKEPEKDCFYILNN